MISLRLLLCAACLSCAATAALAQGGPCKVSSFSGAATGQGADATMTVRNTGEPCSITNYGMAAEKKHPAASGRITKAPAHGTATFDAPAARYTPAPGYVGADSFAYEARATGNVDQQIVLKVRVKVTVTAP